jgi:hypothetical protein
MRKKQIEALMQAHQGRARPVAFLYVLRQPRLEPDDHEFLIAHVDELGPSDMLRWRSRCEPGFTGVVIREIARRAAIDPSGFRHEILDAPKLDIEEDEWRELADLLRGKVPDPIHAIVLERGGARPKRPPPDQLFTPGKHGEEPLTLDDSDLDGEMVDFEAARELPLRELLRKRRKGLLRIDDASMLRLAHERANDGGEDWSAIAREIPSELRDAALEKAKCTPRMAERATLLSWLQQHDLPRKQLLAIALLPPPSKERDFGLGLIDWLARQLPTRSAWDQLGPEVFDTFLDRHAFGELTDLVTLVLGAGRPGDPPRATVEAIHSAFAAPLIARAGRAIRKRDSAMALASLSALACLDPPSRVSRALHELRDLDCHSAEIEELISVNERMLKHSSASDASLEGIVAALHALADTAPPSSG